MDQITIANWHGAAMGGGAAIASALDFRIGAKSCFMSYPEIKIGANLMWQSLPLLVALTGPSRAKRLVISGERAYGPQLLEWGVLDELVDDDDLATTTQQWAEHYAAQAPIAAPDDQTQRQRHQLRFGPSHHAYGRRPTHPNQCYARCSRSG